MVTSRLLCYCFLLAVLDHGLLRNGFSHAATHSSEAARLEGLEAAAAHASAEVALHHHRAAHASSKTASKEIVAKWVAAEAAERIPVFPATSVLGSSAHIHTAAHVHAMVESEISKRFLKWVSHFS